MNQLASFQTDLRQFAERFDTLAEQFDHTSHHCSELERVIDEYSAFITNKKNIDTWEQLMQQPSGNVEQLVVYLRRRSALCVAIMEKYRAFKLQEGHAEISDYFKNIEACIEKEFGSFKVTEDSKVLLVGSGSFPMTPLLIAKRTGAEVVGIDIDDEAIQLGRQVVGILGSELRIRLEQTLVEDIDYTKDATHIIFSSTVANKYELLDQLYALTSGHVVVAMRYGDQLKSLFNYPMREVDADKWRLADQILRPDDVFDIALYVKA